MGLQRSYILPAVFDLVISPGTMIQPSILDKHSGSPYFSYNRDLIVIKITGSLALAP